MGFRATKAWYDRANGVVMMALTNGAWFGVPVKQLKEIARARAEDLEKLELLGSNILHWESLDADYSVGGLVLDAMKPAISSEFARTGGKSTSAAKADAARLNGAMGGRPRRPVMKKKVVR